ncbi:hypothetical protein [Cystobacter ferrugineus]|uniref:Uncharacterized protein n=1 Tax=Cystobacter ferrugineus TaxID=83449 RepID=A0A1L9BDD3_9BACT|nr:hypothetical protein [Cystobacter ferrugineus]OJH40261.1 hypothetical protein BON30_14555 [Cystobacter ferrugineus]
MPHLTNTDWTKLASVARTRNGREIAGTAPPNGNDHRAFACWVWAVSGAPVTTGNVAHMDEFYDAIMAISQAGASFNLTRFNQANANTPQNANTTTALNYIRNNYAAANANTAGTRLLCRTSLLALALIRAGLQVASPDNTQRYQIVARYDNANDPWFARPQHFALALIPGDPLRKFGVTECFVQKVPTTGVRYACSSVWDEGYQELRLGISELTQAQVAILQQATPFDRQF